ncbi:transglycosylase domain-containing protein [Sphingomicrobium clamense]|uniref:PBP1A family penicillin-binding protein n=1 Tax=Sphingomicrobium clamense TaxID=2851013 RepID=A0ABS6V2Y4_9SPHN|nr:PBP1A family penicillin-binding protein [Sphingomicrobium sp. B8]MBW0143922.1 PBP1A family penicillin-binding protein [Sphingomicrobium sp. B8]
MTKKEQLKRWSWRIFKWGLALAAVAFLALAIAVGIAMQSLPSYQELTKRSDLGQTVRMRAEDGTILVSMGPSFGRWLTYDEIPEEMKTAMISVEDRRFRSHPGVDPIGIMRGIKVSLQTGDGVRGVSTISQQLARNIFLHNRRELDRKVREGILALALERKFTKDQILELYLNRVYFGGGAYGIDAASRTFFGHSATEMDLGEAVIVAGLVKAPSRYSPTADVDAARGRASVVLGLMVDQGKISPAEAAAVDPATIRLEKRTGGNSARYFTDWALPQLDTLIDDTNEPIDVWTTLDVSMQDAADAAVNAHAPAGAQGALVAIDRDGAVRAMVGGKDYVESIYNRATVAKRQPGSAFKLFVYLTALENGYRPSDIVVDEPVEIDGWAPRNSNRQFLGEVTVREAFARSINTVSAQFGAQFGFSTIAAMAQRFGISDDISTYPAMVLGTSEVRLIDMTRAFAAVSNGGISVPPYAITKVETAEGRTLYQRQPGPERVLVAPWVAQEMTDLLQSAVQYGTGRAANIGRPVAGKTGTTSSNKDGYFVGFSSGLTTGVWYGRDDAGRVAGLSGGAAPARAFRDFMVRAVANRPVEQFDVGGPPEEWLLEPDEEVWFGTEPLIGPDGEIIGSPYDPLAPSVEVPDLEEDPSWLDDVLRRERQPSAPPIPPDPGQADPRQPAPGRVEPDRPPPGSDPRVVRVQPRQPTRSADQPDPLAPQPQ